MKADLSRSSFDAAKHFRGVRRQQGRVDLDADWNEQQDILDHLHSTSTGDVLGPAAGPLAGGGFQVIPDSTDLLLTPGRYYVDGVLVECEPPAASVGVSVWDQPDAPAGTPVVRLGTGAQVPGPTPPAGRYLVYLDVWDQHRTALEDPDIREVALGGPDSTTRVKTVWQAKLLRLGNVGSTVTCTDPPGWAALTAEPTGLLAARAEPTTSDSGPCLVPADAGFRGLENQHYRVEVRQPGDTGTATFLWARDNASTVASWVAGPDAAGAITVASPGRDSVVGFAPGMWVELTDDSRELRGEPGPLVQVAAVAGNQLTISPAAGIDISDFPRHPRVRRWDSDGAQLVEVPAQDDGWLPLELGVQVRFSTSASYRSGDYWLIPARTNLADILWPRTPSSTPLAVTRHGVRHRFAKLALVSFDGTAWGDPHDCRALFPALTQLTELRAVSGDGQTATPNPAAPTQLVPLPQSLVVGVANGTQPVAGARVRFTAASGALGSSGSNTALTLFTNANGLAQVAWRVDPVSAVQQVTAQLLNDANQPIGLPAGFTASLLTAARTAYTPSGNCADLASTTTVQEAIDVLCERSGGGPAPKPGMHVEQVMLGHGDILRNDAEISADELINGIQVVIDHEIDPTTAHRPTCYVTLELPWPTNPVDRELWGIGQMVGYQRLVLQAKVEANGDVITWAPFPDTSQWLANLIPQLRQLEVEDRVLCRLILKGNYIMSEGRELYLDGDTFLDSKPGQDIILPSGDDHVGGTFELWFWLIA